jgi:hypothetical protein
MLRKLIVPKWILCASAKMKKGCLTAVMLVIGALNSFAVDPNAGSSAIANAVGSFSKYIGPVQNLMYVLAAVISVVGAFSIYFKMNNGDQDVKKSIMLTVGGCLALIVMATALPKFFGY